MGLLIIEGALSQIQMASLEMRVFILYSYFAESTSKWMNQIFQVQHSFYPSPFQK